MEQFRILLVDDEQAIREQLRIFFTRLGYGVEESETPSGALNILRAGNIDVAVFDINLPEMDGLQLLEKARAEFPRLEVIMITGKGEQESVLRAMRLGAFDFFYKPFRLHEIQNAIERTRRYIEVAGQLQDERERNQLLSGELRTQLGFDIVGRSPATHEIIRLIRRAADSATAAVLISGPSGTGKELVARAIHCASSRKDGYFCPLNCAAIPENLIESELFGHRKGAFTGAISDRKGCLVAVSGGTLFLDEIGEMPLASQPRLLRALEDGSVRHLGEDRETTVDVRVISATNSDLARQVAEKRFRLDLYHRLNVFAIDLPPLKERAEDIPLLLDYYLGYFARRLRKPAGVIPDKVRSALMAYDFPGNVRELKNMVERAIMVSDGTELTMAHFNLAPGSCVPAAAAPAETDLNLDRREQAALSMAMRQSGNNQTQAALLLGISRYALLRKLKKHT